MRRLWRTTSDVTVFLHDACHPSVCSRSQPTSSGPRLLVAWGEPDPFLEDPRPPVTACSLVWGCVDWPFPAITKCDSTSNSCGVGTFLCLPSPCRSDAGPSWSWESVTLANIGVVSSAAGLLAGGAPNACVAITDLGSVESFWVPRKKSLSPTSRFVFMGRCSNEVTVGRHLRMGAGCPENQPRDRKVGTFSLTAPTTSEVGRGAGELTSHQRSVISSSTTV